MNSHGGFSSHGNCQVIFLKQKQSSILNPKVTDQRGSHFKSSFNSPSTQKPITFIKPWASMKKSEIMPFTVKQIELETLMLNEISQTQKVKGHLFSLKCVSQRGKRKESQGSHENQREISKGTSGWEAGRVLCWGVTLAKYCYIVCVNQYVTTNPIITIIHQFKKKKM